MADRENRTARNGEVVFGNNTMLRIPAAAEMVAKQWLPSPGRARIDRTPAEQELPHELQLAFDAHEIIEQETIHVELPATLSRAAVDVAEISPGTGVPAGFERVVLYRDESGGLSWHFAENAAPLDARALRTIGRQTFRIPLRTAAARAAVEAHRPQPGDRALVPLIGRKVFKVLLLPIAANLLGDPLRDLVQWWEKRSHPELLRTLTADDLAAPPQPFTDWDHLAGGRALLVIHGIFSSTHGMLSRLPRAQMERLAADYEGRVIAFDHYTVSRSPEENARRFLELLDAYRDGRSFEFDILCHSRGGIVARTLRERLHALHPDPAASFRKIFFVATPNQGSVLADPERLMDLLDVFTNLAVMLTAGSAAVTLEIVLAVLKLIAYAGMTEIPGIAAMAPGPNGYIDRVLNAPPNDHFRDYAAAAATYEPDPSRDSAVFTAVDALIDRIFNDVDNDLVVPTEGVYTLGPNRLTIPHHVFTSGVWHTELFAQPATIDRALEHFRFSLLTASQPSAPRTSELDIELSREIELPQHDVEFERFELPRDEGEESWRGAGADAGGAPGDMPAEGGRRSRTGARAPIRIPEPAAPPAPSPAAPPVAPRSTPPPAAPFPPAAPLPSIPAGFDDFSVVADEPEAAIATEERALPAVTVEREPHIIFHELVHPGVENDLMIRLDQKTAETLDDILGIAIAAGAASVDVTVQLFAPGFKVAPDDVQTITVGRDFNPERERVIFKLTANRVAQKTRREITADFSIAGVSIGGVTHTTWVAVPGDDQPGDLEPAFTSSFNMSAAARSTADLRVIVSDSGVRTESGEAGRFTIRVTSALPGFVAEGFPLGELVVDAAGTTNFVGTTIGRTFQLKPLPATVAPADMPAAIEAWNAKFIDKLTELGMQLWEWLPEKFRDFYFRLYDRKVPPRSVHVVSDDMLFPWELVIPWRNVDGRRETLAPLGMAHVIGRWRPGLFIKPEPQRLPIRKIAIVNPTYPAGKTLPKSQAEADALARAFGAICELVRPCDKATVKQKVLDATDIQLLHFTGHADFESRNPNQSFLALEDGELTAAGIGAGNFTAGAPIVVLNACSVGFSGMVASRAGGFAERCLETGCSAVLAAYWPISDTAAYDFSIAFYDKLRHGRAFGEALQELRLDRPDDPTYRAYTFFGDPLARIVF